MLADIIRRTEAQISRRSSLFRGLSRMSRYHRANISRNVWGGVTLETGDWFRSAADIAANRLASVPYLPTRI